ncbi:Eco57I restriction-modification methylase domain-containing protein [Nocardiopsis flavescens]|uniref:Eco57I restriction-modification methylase domain-containing protein n=1 Tax=Nocardiopsis flavescens TaxID=758803 RepID=UPI0036506D46
MSAIARNRVFESAQTVGGLLPADMLVRISEGKDVEGAKPADYGVRVGSVSDEAERRWEYLKGVWRELRKKLPVEGSGEGPAIDSVNAARPQWVEPLFNELGFGWLNAGPGEGIASDDGAKRFKITHLWQHVPIHVVAWHADLDKRPGGAGTVPPQSYVQEMLNSSSAHLWAVVTNGRQLRLLRDSSALATAAYVEFDLEAIFDGELFNEFVLLFRLLHASRFAVEAEQPPATCWLEKWRGDAISSGERAVKRMSKNVREAISALGTGFLKANPDLRKDLDVKAFHAALLRLVYRMLFLFVAEDRDALHPPGTDEQTRERYAKYFSSAGLRRHARRRRGTSHGDLYQVLTLVLDALGGNGDHRNGRPEIGVPALGGLFTDAEADTPLRGLKLNNETLLEAFRHLAQVRDTESRRWRVVDYRNLDAEELGSIYESLLELVPKYNVSDLTFTLQDLAGNDRKTTGSYYTPSSLIETLLDSALDPVIDDAVKRGQEKAAKDGKPDATESVVAELLDLTVCDPACGSGHFLVAAARRIAKRVAAVREGNPEPTVGAVRHAMHEVVARCIYGVDLNPMAVELAKVSLWLEALEPGKPLNFLDAHVKHGNALMSTTPKLLKDGIPDEAFKPIEGDDKKYARFLAKTNKEERTGQLGLFDIDQTAVQVANTALAENLRRITAVSGDTLDQVRAQEDAYRVLVGSDDYVRARRVADAWCAAFVWKKTEDAPRAVTDEVFRRLVNAKGNGAPYTTLQEIDRLRDQYRFFHWHLEFPDVFTVPESEKGVAEDTGWAGGFDCILGNPPWERISFNDDEFFAEKDSKILQKSTTSARKRAISEALSRGEFWADDYRSSLREVAELTHFFSSSGLYGLTARGRLTTQSLFSSRSLELVCSSGWVGLIVPTGVISDVPMKDFWGYLRESGYIRAVLDCENSEGMFPDVHRSTKFMLLSLQKSNSSDASSWLKIGVFIRRVEELSDPERIYSLPLSKLAVLNPLTKQLPICLRRKDFDLILAMSERLVQSSLSVSPWVGFTSEGFSEHFEESGGPGRVGLFEGKMIHQFDARFADYSSGGIQNVGVQEKANASIARHYCKSGVVDDFLSKKGVADDWVLAVRDYVRAVDSRTAIAAILPKSVPIQPLNGFSVSGGVESQAWALAAVNSFPYDFVAKQKTPGQHFNVTIMRQTPIPEVNLGFSNFVKRRVLELCYINDSLSGFSVALGDFGGPFSWSDDRRLVMRSELDALFFHLYEVGRDDVCYIMEAFPIVKKKDVARCGTYRTKERILEIYDRMAEVGVSQGAPLVDGENFVSELTPPPGHGPRHAPAS